MPNTRYHAAGFTLIELLVVISIIVLLIAILLPALSAARGSARAIQCASIIRQFGIANQGYANDSDDFFVPVFTGVSGPGRVFWFGNDLYRDHLGLPEVASAGRFFDDRFACPEAGFARQVASDDGNPGLAAIDVTYGFNATDLPELSGYPSPTFNFANTPFRGLQRGRPVRPSQTAQMVDSLNETVTRFQSNGWVQSEQATIDASGVANPSGGVAQVAYRHPQESAQVQFFDGHVERLPRVEVVGTGGQNTDLWVIDN
ncbi:MAG: prepilin-type N-terminal cleavage/methylation domain-containing protein [Planctomycetota bacterium]